MFFLLSDSHRTNVAHMIEVCAPQSKRKQEAQLSKRNSIQILKTYIHISSKLEICSVE